ncbi:hypothetical protein VP01_4250g4 [Puccinia sorghi]|uniref:Uncharacterized protein n=1 Tax=Puccinia sorghi TaxID=27349 RepID=A0A0L6UQE6_9BASI|nr:hypothetical protein VP01_4250g4 [Puccinia sorghi]
MSKYRNQIPQAIDLVVKVLPPLPKTGIFDSKLAKKPATSSANVAMKYKENTSESVSDPSAIQ